MCVIFSTIDILLHSRNRGVFVKCSIGIMQSTYCAYVTMERFVCGPEDLRWSPTKRLWIIQKPHSLETGLWCCSYILLNVRGNFPHYVPDVKPVEVSEDSRCVQQALDWASYTVMHKKLLILRNFPPLSVLAIAEGKVPDPPHTQQSCVLSAWFWWCRNISQHLS